MCKDSGVDPQLLKPENLVVRTSRAIGLGSVTQARQIAEKLLDMAQSGMFDQIGQREAVRRLTALLVGWDHVDTFAPRSNRDEIPTNDTSFATVENDVIMKGGKVVVGTDQNHMLHGEVVLAFLEQLAGQHAAAMNGQAQPFDPRMILPAFMVGLPHAAQHIQLAAANVANRPEAKNMLKRLKKVQQEAKRVQAHVEQIAQAEQKQQQAMQQQMADEAAQRDPVMRSEARKDAVTAADIRRGDFKTASEVKRKTEKAEVDVWAKKVKTMSSVQPQMQVPEIGAIPVLDEEGVM
jgi:cell fate (sporulation/competence/biofilm development) regulator YlbF (YheA/YmcA/DUF963 family)